MSERSIYPCFRAASHNRGFLICGVFVQVSVIYFPLTFYEHPETGLPIAWGQIFLQTCTDGIKKPCKTAKISSVGTFFCPFPYPRSQDHFVNHTDFLRGPGDSQFYNYLKTNNALVSFFGHLKENITLHRGMSYKHYQKYVKWYLSFLFIQRHQPFLATLPKQYFTKSIRCR